MGELLRQSLQQEGWTVRNRTKLPVVCFTRAGLNDDEIVNLCARIVKSGEAWISTTLLAGRETVLRACITNYRTSPQDIDDLIVSLRRAMDVQR
jgi:hypothetical protein